jgi:hypothetical protein
MQVIACIHRSVWPDGTQANFRRLTKAPGPIAAPTAAARDAPRRAATGTADQTNTHTMTAAAATRTTRPAPPARRAGEIFAGRATA